MTRAEDLRTAVDAEDEAAVIALIAGLAEPDRAALQGLAREVVAATVKRGIDAAGHLGPTLLLAYGTLPVSDIRKLGWRANHLPNQLVEVLRNRPAERLEPIVTFLLDDVGGWAWRHVRPLVREGFVARPDRPSYTIALIAGTGFDSLAELKATDPGLLEVEAWRLFEVEGGGEDSLANHEKYSRDRWGDLFRELATEDPAMRARLLDASLAALGRDFAAFRAGWFSRFHESLAPTDEERAARVDAYLGLIRSRVGATVSFAVSALTRIQRAGRLAPDDLLDRIGPVLVDGPIGTAKAGLGLVGRAGSGDAGRARRAAIVAAEALLHPAPDVEQAALAQIAKLIPEPDEAVARAVGDRIGGVAASQRAATASLAARLGAPPGDASPDEVARVASQPAESPSSVLDPSRTLAPLTTVEDLVDVAISVLETGESADDLERVLDAVGRLPRDRSAPADRLLPAIAKRARTVLARSRNRALAGVDARADVAAVLLAWAAGEISPASLSPPSIEHGAAAFLSARAIEVAAAAAQGEPWIGVAAPTHRGGWIDPAALVGRLAEHPPASTRDLVAGILRLAPDGRAEALRDAAGLGGEVGAVVRYALGGVEPVGPTAAWWVAAARVRAPGRDDPDVERRHPRLGPDAGRAARITIRPGTATASPWGPHFELDPPLVDVLPQPEGQNLDLPTVLLLRVPNPLYWDGHSETSIVRWVATIQPGDREAWAALGAVALGRNVDWWAAMWGNRVYLEPFLDPLTAIGPMGRTLLGVALGAKDPGERGLAADVVRNAIGDGRLTAEGLAEGLGAAVAMDCDRPKRWAMALADVAADSTATADAVVEAMTLTLPAIADRPPAALVPFLRLLDELLADGQPVIGREQGREAARPMLERLSGSTGQAGRLARSVLARWG